MIMAKRTTIAKCRGWLEAQPEGLERDELLQILHEMDTHQNNRTKGNYYLVCMGPKSFEKYQRLVLE
jgi:hypothetical protein